MLLLYLFFIYDIIILNSQRIATDIECSVDNDCSLECVRRERCNQRINICTGHAIQFGNACNIGDPDVGTCDGEGMCIPDIISTPNPTTLNPTTSQPTTKAPTTVHPTTVHPTTTQPTTAQPIIAPTTAQPTTANPTTKAPTTPAPVPVPTNCGRYRKSWMKLSQTERNLYITGFLELKNQGIIDVLTQDHISVFSTSVHGGSGFLPWHRYFIYELESQIRNLGGEYACFGMPYWDWTTEPTTGDWEILDTGLSGNGANARSTPRRPELDAEKDCVEDGPFGKDNYETTSGKCLERSACTKSSECRVTSPSELMRIIRNNEKYGGEQETDGFRYGIEMGDYAHNYAHCNFQRSFSRAGTLCTPSSPDDPIFYLLHGFIDYTYALWQTCHGYHNATNIDRIIYNGEGSSHIDTELSFPSLINQKWSELYKINGVTPRELQNIRNWDYQYDIGDFFDNGRVGQTCVFDIDEDWFVGSTNNRRRLRNDEYILHPSVKMRKYMKKTERFSKLSYGSFFNSLGIAVMDVKEVNLWSKLNCEFINSQYESKCIRPRNFEGCYDMKINPKTKDIDITLPEMLQRVGHSNCMINTRKKFYKWAKATKTLFELCNGNYDPFCDKDFMLSETRKSERLREMM